VLPDVDARPDTDLPVRRVLRGLLGDLTGAGCAVLVAPPGSGKTTLVPLALAARVAGRIVVAQPRRIAARAAAGRMAALVGGQVGGAVGYTVRGERRVGPATRVEVVTTGVLLQRLQRDPDLAGTGAVVLDECHERHLDTDLALAFAVDVRRHLRPDLLLLAMSASADADGVAGVLGPAGEPAPVIRATADPYPLEILWCPPPRPVDAPHGLRVDPRLLDHVAATVRRALADDAGNVLVFLPGAGEIAAVARRLSGGDVEVVSLHGRLSATAQDAALRPGDRRRVVLATAVAETSLTVSGVRAVVDAGLARVARMDHARGFGALTTVRVSRSIAHQRAGRAAREAPGRVYRCWSAADHDRLAAQPPPEIATADLTGFALALACWGDPDGGGLALPDPPPAAALRLARSSLAALGAVGADGRVTGRGRTLSTIGTHPRLARALLDGTHVVGSVRAAEVVAMLSDDTLAGGGDDLIAAWRRLRSGVDRAASARWRDEARRLREPVRHIDAAADGPPDDLAAGLVVGLAFPERLARAREPGASSYLTAGGTAADLAVGSALAGTAWLAIAIADRGPGQAAARIRLAAAVDEATAREAGAALLSGADEVAWRDGDLAARRVERLGAVILSERRLASPDRALVAAAFRDALRREGLRLLPWSRAARDLRQRLAFCHHALGDGWPDVGDEALLAAVETWLGPELAGARRRADLQRIDLVAALRRLVPWDRAGRLDTVAPDRIEVPSGSRIRVDYSDPAAPALAVKVQETFGWRVAPTLAGGRVPVVLRLLSPAGRPVAVTTDLASFWQTGYRQVRAELRGRYPRHAWPEDGATADPTRRAGDRLR
jgi:ATP-dependent helicase HrpB